VSEEHLLVEKSGHVLIARMNRPEAKNAFSPNMLARLYEAWTTANEDDEVRCVILTGSGTVFCAGADLKAMMSNPAPDDTYAQRFRQDADMAWKALRVGVVRGGVAHHRLEVGAGAEHGVRAGEDDAADLVVLVRLRPRLVHPGEHVGREGVLRLRPVHPRDEDVPGLLDEQVLLAHR
jgi:hypothetical protein